jgi:Asp-tRNA(Asn)/Glu-tRNA(Gln) amidotransferase A subunit family amidase
VPTRRVTRLHLRVQADDLVLAIAEVSSRAGTPGQQTQLWRNRDGVWRVTAAHVAAPARTLDTTVWRVAGAPLVAPTGTGPLDGSTVAVKDLFAVRGFAIGGGVPAFLASAPVEPEHAPAVASLLAAGAAITGIAQTDQFAYSISGINSAYGTPVNPAAPDRVPGGSSSGPSVAVSRGEVTIGLGTDTAGSVRAPASYQGLWGIRSTHRAVDVRGVLPLAPSFDTVGWLTRDSETLAAVADVLLPAAPESLPPDVPPVVVPALTALASEPVREVFSAAAAALGASEIDVEMDIERWFAAFRTVQAAEAWECHGEWIQAHSGALGADIVERFRDASAVTAGDAARAREVLAEGRAAVAELLAQRVLLLPTTSDLPPSLGASADEIDSHRARTLRLTSIASLAGAPAVSAPLLRVAGAPAGLCFAGARHTDADLIKYARRASMELSR